jgi:hypothetical protein
MTKCKVEGCAVTANYSVKGINPGIYCSSHSDKDTMWHVYTPKCINGCLNKKGHPVSASYGGKGKDRTHCGRCGKLEGLKSTSIHCEVCNEVRPVYNLPGEEKGLRCEKCKLTGMKNVVHKMCKKCGIVRPSFSNDQKSGEYCAKCRDDIDPEMPDVNNNLCPCGINATYGLPGTRRATSCASCKIKEMEDLNSPRCIEGCGNIAYYHFPDTPKTGKYCRPCAKKTDPNLRLVSAKRYDCQKCGLSFTGSDEPKLCNYCNKDGRKNSKEAKIKKLLEKKGIEFVHDKSCAVSGVCQRFRPDFLIDRGTYFLIVEVDENHHSQYNPECEIARMNTVCYNLGLPVVFLRYNPDLEGVRTQKKHNKLLERIKYYSVDFTPEPAVTIEYLFYPE